jgi:hypothetical protein
MPVALLDEIAFDRSCWGVPAADSVLTDYTGFVLNGCTYRLRSHLPQLVRRGYTFRSLPLACGIE